MSRRDQNIWQHLQHLKSQNWNDFIYLIFSIISDPFGYELDLAYDTGDDNVCDCDP